MRNILKNRKALSTVVTTLIILVVSVLLAGVVTYFAINVTSTRVQQESLNLMYQHLWFDTTSGTGAEAAIMIVNTGGRDVVLNNIAVRGQAVSWGNVFYNISSKAITGDLTYNATLFTTTSGKANSTVVGLNTYILNTNPTNSLTLASGSTMLIYVVNPDSISVNDIGLTIAISVFTAQATYYKETNVESALP